MRDRTPRGRCAVPTRHTRLERLRLSIEILESRWTLSATPGAGTADAGVESDFESDAALAAADFPHLRAHARRLATPGDRVLRRVEAGAAAAAVVAAAAAPTAPTGDFNGDGKVDRADAAILALNFGRSADANFANGDLTGDGIVSLADLAAMRFGPGSFDITAPLGTSDDDAPDVAWTASPGAVRYDATIETAAGCEGTSVVQSRQDVVATSAAFDSLADGTYYACVTAYDDVGNPIDATNNGLQFAIATQPTGSLSIEHTASATSVSTPGVVVNYTYTVQNTGATPLSNVTVEDSRSLVVARQADSPGDGDDLLEIGETWRFAASYTVAQADLSGGVDLVSTATADSDQSDPATHEAVLLNLFELAEITVGSVRVVPIDHASFVMLWNDVTIYVDPVGNAGLYAGLPKADLVLVTHRHGDHYNATTISAIADTDVRIITSQTVYNQSSFASLRSVATTIGYGQSVNLLGLNVEAVHAYNGNHPLNEGNGYVVTIDGARFYAAGDTGAVAEIRVLPDIDAAFLPMNIPFTMTVDEAASVTRDMQPAMVIPYHYRNSGGSFADLAQFKSLVGRDLDIAVRLLDWY